MFKLFYSFFLPALVNVFQTELLPAPRRLGHAPAAVRDPKGQTTGNEGEDANTSARADGPRLAAYAYSKTTRM